VVATAAFGFLTRDVVVPVGCSSMTEKGSGEACRSTTPAAASMFRSRAVRRAPMGRRSHDGAAAVLPLLGLLLFLTTPAIADEAPAISDADQEPASTMDFAATRSALGAYEGGDARMDYNRLRDALTKDALRLLKAQADGGRSLEGQPVLIHLQEALQRSVAGLPLADQMKANVASIHVADRAGESEDVVLFGIDNLRFSPVIAIHRLASRYDVLPATATPTKGIFLGEIRALDVTGDGVDEAIVTRVDDGSASPDYVDVLRWVGGNDFFKLIFSMTLSSWGGPPCDYRFVPAGSGQDIEVTLPVVGVFDGRIPHRADTQLWKYDPTTDAFVVRGESVEPPKNVRQQLNEGERLLRLAELQAAVTAYHRAWSDPSLSEDDELRADYRNFARFREGELLAILGRETEARAALHDAEMRGGTLGAFARAFSMNYSGPDGAVHAWVALPNAGHRWQYVSIDGVTEEPAIPGQSADVLYLGQPVASYLTAHPDAAATPDTVFTTLRGWGLETTAAVGVDLDGDGTNEFLFQTPKDGAWRVWVVHRSQGRWLVDDSLRWSITAFGDVLPLPKGSAIRVTMAARRPGSNAVALGNLERALTSSDGRLVGLEFPSLKPLTWISQRGELSWPDCLAKLPY